MSKRRGDGIYLRGKTWWLDFVHRGERHIVRIGSNINRTVAKELASVERAKVLRNEAGIGRVPNDLPFEEAKELFLAWAKANKRPNTVRSYADCLTQLSKSSLFAGKRLGQITAFAVERYKQERRQDGVRVRQNRELAVLRNLFNRMREFKKFEGGTPMPTQKRLMVHEPPRRLVWLEAEEEQSLLAALDDPERTVVLTGIHAGLRIKAEACRLTWADIDLRRGTLTVPAAYAKNGATRTVPLNSVLREAFTRLKNQAVGEHVFVNRRGERLRDIDAAFAAACRTAKLAGMTPHTTRHTFASRLVMAGVSLRTVQELGGWKTLAQVQRYAHLSEAHKVEAVERLAIGTARPSPDAIHDTRPSRSRARAS